MAQESGAKYGELLITNYDPRPYLKQLTLFEVQGDLGDMKLIQIPDQLPKRNGGETIK